MRDTDIPERIKTILKELDIFFSDKIKEDIEVAALVEYLSRTSSEKRNHILSYSKGFIARDSFES